MSAYMPTKPRGTTGQCESVATLSGYRYGPCCLSIGHDGPHEDARGSVWKLAHE